MASWDQKDYVMRQVRGILAMVLRMMGLRLAGMRDEAKMNLEQAYGLLLGPEAELVRRADVPTAAFLLGSPEKIAAYAQLINEEAAQEEDQCRQEDLRVRATQLVIEGVRLDPDCELIRHTLGELSEIVDWQRLSASQREALERLGYHDCRPQTRE